MVYTLGDIGNVPGQAYDFLKRQAGRFVNLTKPGADDDDYTTRSAAIARQRKLADMLSQMGEQEQAVSTAGGITAPMSGMGALARGLTSFGGAYLSGKASADEAAVTKAKEGEDAETLRQIGEALAGTPEETVALAPTDPTLGQRNLQDIMSMSGSRQPTPDELAAALGGNAPPGRAVMKNMVPGDVSKAAQIGLGNPRFANQGLALLVGETQRRAGRVEDLQDRDAAAIAADDIYQRNRRDVTTDAASKRGQQVRDETRRRLTTEELSDAGYRPGTVAYIDGLGRITVPQAGETPSQIAAAGRAGQRERLPTPALLQADARALAKAIEASQTAVSTVEALERSYAILSNPNSLANAALPEITFINSVLSLFGNEKATQRVTDANLLSATGDIAGIAALAGIGGSDTERELAVATRTAYGRRGTREQNKELTARKISAFRFVADYPLLASDWIAKYGSLHPTFKDEDGGTFARFADREYKRIRAEVDAMGTRYAQNAGGTGQTTPGQGGAGGYATKEAAEAALKAKGHKPGESVKVTINGQTGTMVLR